MVIGVTLTGAVFAKTPVQVGADHSSVQAWEPERPDSILGGQDSEPAVATDGRNWLVVYEARVGRNGAILAELVGPDGDRLTLPVEIGPGFANYVNVVFDGEAYVVVWDAFGGYFVPPPPMVFAQRVSTSGVLLGDRIKLHEATGDYNNVSLAAAPEPGHVVVKVCDEPGDDCRTWVVASSGAMLSDADQPVSELRTKYPSRWPAVGAVEAVPTEQWTPQAAPAPDGWLVAWRGRWGVNGASLDRDGVPRGTDFPITPRQSDLLELSRGPQGWLVVTLEDTSVGDFRSWEPRLWLLAAPNEMARPLPDLAGPERGPYVSQHDATCSISVVASTQGWLVTWIGAGGVHATRLAPDGTVVDDTPIPEGVRSLGAALQGDSYAVFYAVSVPLATGGTEMEVRRRDLPISGASNLRWAFVRRTDAETPNCQLLTPNYYRTADYIDGRRGPDTLKGSCSLVRLTHSLGSVNTSLYAALRPAAWRRSTKRGARGRVVLPNAWR